ncbi:MAG: sigma-70 family RNA polymerase sigma factor [Bacteroidaceae bacterium]|nr:sigma-70 family RNA polymerase sigma factor [Bacteroidaceae bacterium]
MKEISFRDDILPLKDKLFRVALRITFDRAEAEDIVQETLIKVWNKREEWNSLESIEAYSLTLTKNLAIDLREKMDAKTEELTEQHDRTQDDANPHEKLEQKERLMWVHRLIEGLPEKQRRIMQMRDIEEKSYKEIAQALDTTEEQVKINLFRARQKVKQGFLRLDAYERSTN